MDQAPFVELVERAIAAVPERFRRRLENVAFVVEPAVRLARPNEAEIRRGRLLLGLYQGVPYGQRGAWYSGVLPDKITIFQSAN